MYSSSQHQLQRVTPFSIEVHGIMHTRRRFAPCRRVTRFTSAANSPSAATPVQSVCNNSPEGNLQVAPKHEPRPIAGPNAATPHLNEDTSVRAMPLRGPSRGILFLSILTLVDRVAVFPPKWGTHGRISHQPQKGSFSSHPEDADGPRSGTS